MKQALVAVAALPAAVAGFPTDFASKGFRIIPVLASGASRADVEAAYASLKVTITRNSQARAESGVTPYNVSDVLSVVGPDWHRSPGFGAISITNAQIGVSYLVQWAEDCLEMVNVLPPALPGFGEVTTPTATASTTTIGPGGAATQTQASAAGNIPTAATDGVEIPAGIVGAYADIEAPAGQTLSAVTEGLVWWRYSAAAGRWRETTLQEVIVTGRRDAGGLEQSVKGKAGDRLYVEARNVSTSGAGALTVRLSIF